jgi:hypothetical protein
MACNQQSWLAALEAGRATALEQAIAEVNELGDSG